MKRIAVVAALGLLSGCSQQPVPAQTHGEALFSEMLKSPPLANSVMRDGDNLSFQVLARSNNACALTDIAQIQASCTSPSASLLFFESPTSLNAQGKPLRFAPMIALKPSITASLAQNPGFIDACAHTPAADWRVISGAADQRWLIIDRSSLKSVGDDVQFWGAYDEPVIKTHADDKMQYAQQRMHFAASCSRQTYRTLGTYGLNTHNLVTFGTTEKAPQDSPFSAAEPDTQTLLNAACGAASSLASLPLPTLRSKRLQIMTPAPIPAAVLQAINALDLPAPQKSLQHLAYNDDSGRTPIHYDMFFGQDANSGQLKIRVVSPNSTAYEVSLRGLVSLTYQVQFESPDLPPMSLASNVEQMSFSGDWKHMPVASSIGFAVTQRLRRADKEVMVDRKTTCTVTGELPATTVFATLTGTAKALDCSTATGKDITTSTTYYLQDYGFFIATRTAMPGNHLFHTTVLGVQ